MMQALAARWVTPARALLSILALSPLLAWAQLDQAITDQDLVEPWTRATAVLSKVPADGLGGRPDSNEINSSLERLEQDLGSLARQLEETAVSIVARPEFAYDAAQASHELSFAVARVVTSLDALSGKLAPGGSPEMQAAREGMEKLRVRLAERTWFERDVMRTVGSGSKHAIQDLARRWWMAGEHVEDLQTAVAALRQRLVLSTPWFRTWG